MADVADLDLDLTKPGFFLRPTTSRCWPPCGQEAPALRTGRRELGHQPLRRHPVNQPRPATLRLRPRRADQ